MCTPLLYKLCNKAMHTFLKVSNCAEWPVKLRWATGHSVVQFLALLLVCHPK